MRNEYKTKTRAGFTLAEIMAVLFIVGLLFAVAAKNFMGTTKKAEVTATKANLKVLHESVNMFRMDTGRYPTEDEGLQALVEQPADIEEGYMPGGYLETSEVPRDAWKRDFIYIVDPEEDRPFVIISYGADGEEDGEGYDADLYSTDVD